MLARKHDDWSQSLTGSGHHRHESNMVDAAAEFEFPGVPMTTFGWYSLRFSS
jgi:hypothetical protein